MVISPRSEGMVFNTHTASTPLGPVSGSAGWQRELNGSRRTDIPAVAAFHTPLETFDPGYIVCHLKAARKTSGDAIPAPVAEGAVDHDEIASAGYPFHTWELFDRLDFPFH
jgi:hypothetical protein